MSYSILSLDIHNEANKWQLNYYQEYQKQLFNHESENEIQPNIKKILNFVEQNSISYSFRSNLVIGQMQFTIGIFPDEKRLIILNKNLSYELTLIDFYTQNNESEKIEDICELTQKVAAIPVGNTPADIHFLTFEHDLPDFNSQDFDHIHEKSTKLVQDLISEVKSYNQSIFEQITDFGLDLTAHFMLIRIHLLKFLAILPSLDHDLTGKEVKRIFLETLRRLNSDSIRAKHKKYRGQKRPLPKRYLAAINFLAKVSYFIPASALAFIIRKSTAVMAKRFIAGENIKLAQKSLQSLLQSGRDATLDQLGELVVSNKEADQYADQVIEIIEGLSEHITPGARNAAGINRAHVSIKVTALSNDFKTYAFDYTYNMVAPRLKRILIAGKENQVFVNIDAEHYQVRDVVLKIFGKVLLETPELNEYADTGIVLQAYLTDAYTHFQDIIALAKKRGLLMPIRLVKGAYWDAETVEATAHNFDAPQFLNKEETDIHFRQIVYKSLQHPEQIQLALASHNIQDHSFAETLRSEQFPDAPVIEHQCLHMTYEALSVGLNKMGWPTRNYIPIGNLLVGMAYLVRRIMENSSQVGILTIMRSHNKTQDSRTPSSILEEKFEHKNLDYNASVTETSREFKNIYPLRTYIESELSSLKKEFDKINQLDLLHNEGDEEILCSSEPSRVLAKIKNDNLDSTNKKIQHLFEGFCKTTWKDQNSDRYGKLLKLADLLLIKREELTAIIMLEAGKTIDEAIADVDEAIDFIHFYVRGEIKLQQKYPAYQSKGVIGVIAPWNFPLAISCGMSVAALAAGNTVLLKPAEQTPIIALKLLELAREAGISASEFDLACGDGEIGKAIVDHELISGVIFTGSKEVGTSIYKKLKTKFTSDKYDFAPVPKTVVTEMGGKNAIIITNNCELDETVSGVIYAAFAHSGQKCSAASRIIIHKEIKDAFINRFAEAVKDIQVGKSYEFSTMINPLITKEDKLRVQTIVKKAADEAIKTDGRVILDLSSREYPGYCVGPAIFEVSGKTAMKADSIAATEIFGPVIHIVEYETVDEAIEIFNSTPYALTGGIYCQSQDDIDEIVPKLHSGNFYINRPNTGARVAIEPFGGFKMSGTGPKAGSLEYLYCFHRLEASKNKDYTTSEKQIKTSNIDKFKLTNCSRLSWYSRKEKTIRYLDTIIANYESYFKIIGEVNKDHLKDLQSFFSQKDVSLEKKEFPNRYIPGQMSFNKRDLGLGNGLFVITDENVNFETFIEIIFNFYIGNGINVLATNEDGFNKWNDLFSLAFKIGFSTYNINCSLVSKSDLSIILKNEEYKFIFLEKENPFLNESLTEVFGREFHQYMIHSFITGQHAIIGDWQRYIEIFTLPRAYAVNTMRHGAPLELDL